MTNLKPLYPFENVFPTVFKGFLPPAWMDTETMPQAFKLDVEETEKLYTIKAEIPGVAKEDIHVDVDGNLVTIRAEARREAPGTEAREGKLLRGERYFGAMARAFTLPVEVDTDAAVAKYENGVLMLTLPKKTGAATHRVTIQ